MINRVNYENPELTYNSLVVDQLVSSLAENPENFEKSHIDSMLDNLKNLDYKSRPLAFKENLISNTNLGEVSISNRLEAQILK